MYRSLLLLVPALMLQAAESPIPGATEVRPGVWVLRGVPTEEVFAALKGQRITHVVDLRRDGEANFNCEAEASTLGGMSIQYIRFAISTTPPNGDFDFLCSFVKDLPPKSRVLFHCGDGNRAAAAVCPWLVLAKGMPLEEAIQIAKAAGLQLPATEQALRRYFSAHGRG